MTGDEWADFCSKHATVFQLFAEADVEMLASWRPILGHHALKDLAEASSFIATLESSRWKTQHCELLNSRVRAKIRARQQTWDDAGFTERPEKCDFGCINGTHILPHPRSVTDGSWNSPYYTCLIFCKCRNGQAKSEAMWNAAQKADGKIPPPMGLESYEARVPNWAELLAQRENGRKDQELERYLATKADATPIDLAEVRRQLAVKWGMPS